VQFDPNKQEAPRGLTGVEDEGGDETRTVYCSSWRTAACCESSAAM
jgi:hypothetical protein